MRKTIDDWKKDWIETNGLTNELEVIIKDGSLKNQILGLMRELVYMRVALRKYRTNY